MVYLHGIRHFHPENVEDRGICFYVPFGCDDCKHTKYAKYANECNEQYASKCEGKCWACYPADGSSFSGELTCYDTDGKGHHVP
jgi:hypothetical protein